MRHRPTTPALLGATLALAMLSLATATASQRADAATQRTALLQAAPPSVATVGQDLVVPLAGICPADSSCTVTVHYRPADTQTANVGAVLLAPDHWPTVSASLTATPASDGSTLLSGEATIPGSAIDSRGLLLTARLDAQPTTNAADTLGDAPRTLHAYWPGGVASDTAATQPPPIVADVVSAGGGPVISHVPPLLAAQTGPTVLTWNVACNTSDASTCTSDIRYTTAAGTPTGQVPDPLDQVGEPTLTGSVSGSGHVIDTYSYSLPPTTHLTVYYRIDATDGTLTSTAPGAPAETAPLAAESNDLPITFVVIAP